MVRSECDPFYLDKRNDQIKIPSSSVGHLTLIVIVLLKLFLDIFVTISVYFLNKINFHVNHLKTVQI